MTNHIRTAIGALPDSNTRGMPEADKATIALAHAAVAIAEQLQTANRIALIAARPGAAASPDVREALQQISDELKK